MTELSQIIEEISIGTPHKLIKKEKTAERDMLERKARNTEVQKEKTKEMRKVKKEIRQKDEVGAREGLKKWLQMKNHPKTTENSKGEGPKEDQQIKKVEIYPLGLQKLFCAL